MLKKLALGMIILSAFLYTDSLLAQTTTATPTQASAATPTTNTSSPAQEAGARAAGLEAPSAPTTSPTPPRTGTPQETTTFKKGRPFLYLGVGLSLLNGRSYTALMPKAYAGYASFWGPRWCRRLFWGNEIFVGIGSLALSPNRRYRVTSLYGASVQPGFKWNDWTIVFFRIGVQSVYYERLAGQRVGAILGAGFQTYSSEHWDLRGEYDYNTNRNLSQYNLDLIYKFC